MRERSSIQADDNSPLIFVLVSDCIPHHIKYIKPLIVYIMSMYTPHGLESWQLDPISLESKLDYDNYSLWSARTKIILQSRGLWGLVDGTEVAPRADAEEIELVRWKMRDASARLQIMANVPDKWLWVFRRAPNVREAWVAILDHFQPHSTFKQSLALRKFSSLTVSDEGDVRAHVIRMGDLWQDVLDTGAYSPESPEADLYFVTTLLKSLPPSWSVFATSWELAPDKSRASGSAVVGHILDHDAWNRGRAEAHKWRSAAQRKARSNNIVED